MGNGQERRSKRMWRYMKESMCEREIERWTERDRGTEGQRDRETEREREYVENCIICVYV
jgi:hypothetical protein